MPRVSSCWARSKPLTHEHIGLDATDDGVWATSFNTVLRPTGDERWRAVSVMRREDLQHNLPAIAEPVQAEVVRVHVFVVDP